MFALSAALARQPAAGDRGPALAARLLFTALALAVLTVAAIGR